MAVDIQERDVVFVSCAQHLVDGREQLGYGQVKAHVCDVAGRVIARLRKRIRNTLRGVDRALSGTAVLCVVGNTHEQRAIHGVGLTHSHEQSRLKAALVGGDGDRGFALGNRPQVAVRLHGGHTFVGGRKAHAAIGRVGWKHVPAQIGRIAAGDGQRIRVERHAAHEGAGDRYGNRRRRAVRAKAGDFARALAHGSDHSLSADGRDAFIVGRPQKQLRLHVRLRLQALPLAGLKGMGILRKGDFRGHILRKQTGEQRILAGALTVRRHANQAAFALRKRHKRALGILRAHGFGEHGAVFVKHVQVHVHAAVHAAHGLEQMRARGFCREAEPVHVARAGETAVRALRRNGERVERAASQRRAHDLEVERGRSLQPQLGFHLRVQPHGQRQRAGRNGRSRLHDLGLDGSVRERREHVFPGQVGQEGQAQLARGPAQPLIDEKLRAGSRF